MANQITRVYRNDSQDTYVIPGLGEFGPDQRISITSEFPPAINLVNYPGLVDVHEEEADESTPNRDYEQNPETPYEEQGVENLTAQPKQTEEPQNG